MASGAPHGELLDGAVTYAGRGWPVFPVAGIGESGACRCRAGAACAHPGKHPLTRHGLRGATCDVDQLRTWWRSWPTANVAVVTGAVAGTVVIDVDLEKGGRESLAALEQRYGPLPATLTARTGGGGLHMLYAHPGREVRNRAGGLPGVTDPLPGIDLRGDGGYIVAAPSLHASGRRYEWADPAVAVATWPGWLIEQRRLASDGPQAPWVAPTGGGSRYGLAAMERELDGLRRAGEGQRNNRLNRAAWSLGMLVGGGELDEATVVDRLRQTAAGVGLRPKEAEATIASGVAAGRERPRRRPGKSLSSGGMGVL